ncbi:uncharacterized protein LOC106466348 isoform X2 [Limulus polyphemus]|uniref:Uncharacterized protein LOC106466348 isoform X2 n=1 Tax=Limulus polyphemus TaxID=6850 RepID=A0ABM1T2E1_LIMPO|nr:uncharacterized protein LOC106466348 isoform X2 [Limulus polyphemus]
MTELINKTAPACATKNLKEEGYYSPENGICLETTCVNQNGEKENQYENTVDLLHHAAEQCQMVANRLKWKELQKKRSTNGQELSTQHEISLNVLKCECCSEMAQKLKASVTECGRLRKVIKEITDVNKRWQKYNQERQEYLQQLLTNFQELQQRVNTSNCNDSLLENSLSLQTANSVAGTHGSYRHSDSALLNKPTEQLTLKQSYEKVVKDNCRLQKEQEEMRQNFEALVYQLDLVRNERKEHIEVLEMQVRAHKEDWEAEKREKEEAQIKLKHLTEELSTAKAMSRDLEQQIYKSDKTCHCSSESQEKALVVLNGHGQANKVDQLHQWWAPNSPATPSNDQKKQNISPNEPASIQNVNNQTYYSSVACNIYAPELPEVLYRGVNFKPQMKTNDLVVDVSTFHPKANNSPTRTTLIKQLNGKVSPQQNKDKADDAVECPGCLRMFPSHRHIQFLDHFEQCQKSQASE